MFCSDGKWWPPVWLSASPQYASAKVGSACSAFWNAAAASSHSKLWRNFTPSMKKGWAAADPEFGKVIEPSVAFWPEAGEAINPHASPIVNAARRAADRERALT
jgi:hypothetical protein